MRRSHPGLPRVRLSFPGSPTSKLSPKPAPWAAVLLLFGVVLLVGYVRLAGTLRLGDFKDSSSSGSSSINNNTTSSSISNSSNRNVTTQAAASALQNISSTLHAGAGRLAADVEGIQSMQQGMDFGSDGTMRMLSVRQQPASYVSFLTAQPGIKDTADAMSRRPVLHGSMQKQGMADPRAWLRNHTDTRMDNFMSWRLNRVRAGGPGPANATSYTCPASDHPPMTFPGCHVFVNHEYKYIYIRTPKAASTSIVNALGECDNVRTRGYNSSSCMALHFYWNSTVLEQDNLQKMWKDYFVFGFVRNPWRRAYSLYKYLHSSGCMDDASLKKPECRVPWSSFCQDPWSAAEELHDRGCIKRSKSYLYFHMVDQFHCMVTAQGGWAVDYIGRVDGPNNDWAEVVKTLNARRAPGIPELPVTELEQQNVRKGGTNDPYSADQMQCFDSVSRWYACDIEHFGFAAAKQV